MILSFKQRFEDGSRTHFVDKIWEGLLETKEATTSEYLDFDQKHCDKFGTSFNNFFLVSEFSERKYHSIRPRRKGNKQWAIGDKIHMAINPRSPNYFQFAPTLEVKRVDDIDIKYSWFVMSEKKSYYAEIFVNGESIGTWDMQNPRLNNDPECDTIRELAYNDGFLTVGAF